MSKRTPLTDIDAKYGIAQDADYHTVPAWPIREAGRLLDDNDRTWHDARVGQLHPIIIVECRNVKTRVLCD